MAKTFLGGALPNSPEASPVFADVRGLPPILVQIGEGELMLSDAIRLASHLRESRVRVSLEIWPASIAPSSPLRWRRAIRIPPGSRPAIRWASAPT